MGRNSIPCYFRHFVCLFSNLFPGAGGKIRRALEFYYFGRFRACRLRHLAFPRRKQQAANRKPTERHQSEGISKTVRMGERRTFAGNQNAG